VDIHISGIEAADCVAEQYAFDGATSIKLPNQEQTGDCVHDKLVANNVDLKTITYDSTSDSITVEAKYKFMTVSIMLHNEKAQQFYVQQTSVAEQRGWFAEFKAAHFRRYFSAEEENMRFSVFQSTLALIAERNANGDLGKHFINEFADLSSEEFKARFLGYRPKHNLTAPSSELHIAHAAASSIDWRSHSPAVLTPVKNQGRCGSCWAFSATEQIETDVALATGTLLTLSPQQITSCDKTDGGCNGGNTETAYKYVVSAGGLETESGYPYTSGAAGVTGTCKAASTDTKSATISGFSTVSKSPFRTSEPKMVSQIQSSPISVCVDAETWQTYTSGIVGSSCGKQLDHCVQAVGLNVDGAKPYWIVRNSWGTTWGNSGYIYVEQGINACGIANDATITTGGKLV